MTNCACGRPLPAPKGTGRPRIRCESCASDKSALGKAWRASHPQEVADRNRSRLKPWPTNVCVTDGRMRRPSKYMPDAQRRRVTA